VQVGDGKLRNVSSFLSLSLSLSLPARFIRTIKMKETPVDAKDARAHNRENLSVPSRKKFSLRKEDKLA